MTTHFSGDERRRKSSATSPGSAPVTRGRPPVVTTRKLATHIAELHSDIWKMNTRIDRAYNNNSNPQHEINHNPEALTKHQHITYLGESITALWRTTLCKTGQEPIQSRFIKILRHLRLQRLMTPVLKQLHEYSLAWTYISSPAGRNNVYTGWKTEDRYAQAYSTCGTNLDKLQFHIGHYISGKTRREWSTDPENQQAWKYVTDKEHKTQQAQITHIVECNVY